jgi:hypothetical protein
MQLSYLYSHCLVISATVTIVAVSRFDDYTNIQAFLLGIWEFSYSPLFANNNYTFVVCFKVVQVFIDYVLDIALQESLMITPLVVSIGTCDCSTRLCKMLTNLVC